MAAVKLTLHPLSPFQLLPRLLTPFLFLLYSCSYARSHPPHHLPISLFSFSLGYAWFHFTSAPGAGKPNAADVWLKERGIVGQDFCFSMAGSLKLGWGSIGWHLHHWVFLLLLNALCFSTRHMGFFTRHRSVYWMVIAFNFGGASQGLKYADYNNVLYVKTGDVKHPLNPLTRAPRMALPFLFLLYSGVYALSHPPHHMPLSLAGYAAGLVLAHVVSAPAAGMPPKLGLFLKRLSILPLSQGLSLRTSFPWSFLTVHVQFHSWFFAFLANLLCFVCRHCDFFQAHRSV